MVMRECACSCGEAFPPMRSVNGRNLWKPKFYVMRHHRRGKETPGNGHMRDVASRAVMRAVAASGVPIPVLAAETGIPRHRLYRYRSNAQPWMRRATGEAILAAARKHAGKRRAPLPGERARTVPSDPAFQTQQERADARRQRATNRKREARAS